MGHLFLHRTANGNNKCLCCIGEMITICVIMTSFYIYTQPEALFGRENIRYTLLFLPSSVMLIWLIALNQGFFRYVLCLKYLKRLGDYSPYIFLIHHQTIKICYGIFKKLIPGMVNIVICAIAFITTIFAAVIWSHFQTEFGRSIFNYKKERN